ncbi:hypothetical protein ACFY9N_11830 [Microbacterium sp. NPDC008134]|uniref:hypothetical protein n=1 Tax=Microbacterium sp. NPDC008134 TaxID=3364183 RepID=UPI0036DFD81D
MSTYAASMAVRDKVTADGLTAEQVAGVYDALPKRSERSEDESAVAFGLSLAHGALRRTEWAETATPDLLDILDTLTDENGTYVDGGEGLASSSSDAIDTILSARYGVDVWEEWEIHPTYVETQHPECGQRFRRFQRWYWEGRDRGDVMRRARVEAPELYARFEAGAISSRKLQRLFHTR